MEKGHHSAHPELHFFLDLPLLRGRVRLAGRDAYTVLLPKVRSWPAQKSVWKFPT